MNNPCTEVADFTAYKVTEASIMLGGPSKINRGIRQVAIDTRYGIAVHSASGGRAEITDSRVYGELTDNEDCPQGSPCDHCLDSRGMVLNMAAEEQHDDRQPKWYKLPLFKTSGAMQGDAKYTNLELINYLSPFKTCGAK